MDLQPAPNDGGVAAAPKSPGRGNQRRSFDAERIAQAFHPPRQGIVFHQGNRADTTDGIENPAADELSGIPVIKPARPDPCVKGFQPAAEVVIAVEQQTEIAARRIRVVLQRRFNCRQPGLGKHCIRMQKKHGIADSLFSARRQLTASPRRRMNDANAQIFSHGHRLIGTAAIGDDDFVSNPLAHQPLNQPRQVLLFVEGRNDDGNHIATLSARRASS